MDFYDYSKKRQAEAVKKAIFITFVISFVLMLALLCTMQSYAEELIVVDDGVLNLTWIPVEIAGVSYHISFHLENGHRFNVVHGLVGGGYYEEAYYDYLYFRDFSEYPIKVEVRVYAFIEGIGASTSYVSLWFELQASTIQAPTGLTGS